MTTITKATIKGQITLPASWRRNFATDQFLVKERGDILEVRPLFLKDLENAKEYTVFDAIRDNKGKGLKANDLIRLLKKIDG